MKNAALAGLYILFVLSNTNMALAETTDNTVEKLKSYLLSDNQSEAVAAANALGSLQAAGALEALIGSLQLGPQPQVLGAILEGIGRHKSPKTLTLLGNYARHRRADIRLVAMESALGIPNAPVEKLILEALGDSNSSIRAFAAKQAGERGYKTAERTLFLLLKRGDKSAAVPLGLVAGPETAKQLGELIGVVPSSTLIDAMGTMLMRKDFGPDPLRTEVVKTIGKLDGSEVAAVLKEYVSSLPEKDGRQSKTTAKKIIDTRKN